jgi:hypothetical protein
LIGKLSVVESMSKHPSIALFLLLLSGAARAFFVAVPAAPSRRTARVPPKTCRTFGLPPPPPTRLLGAPSPFLGDFKTGKGEVVDPYRVLGVPRDADTSQVKSAYRALSRRYHPDGTRHRSILPGSCNSWEEARDHWERIRVSYEILRSPVLRKRYDRHEVLSDPPAALRRAAVGAAVRGARTVGQGLFQGLVSAGSFAFEQMTKERQPPPSAKRSRVDSSETESDGGPGQATAVAAEGPDGSVPAPELAP